MKKLLFLILLLINGYSYSQNLINFYIEPSGTNQVTLHTIVYKNTFTSLGSTGVSGIDDTLTVTLCYLNTSGQSITLDSQEIDIDLPNGYNNYTINIELYGDNDAVQPCSLENLVDMGIIAFDYPLTQDATTFVPDDVFEDYLEALDMGDGMLNNDYVYTHRIINSTHLFLGNQFIPLSGEITNMEGLQDFVSLKELRCNGNQIISLDVSENLNLEKIKCNSNPISELDVSNNFSLTWLNCSNTDVYSINVTNNIYLERLEARNNTLSIIDLSQNSDLIYLDIDNNLLSELNLENNILLEYLNCNDNLIPSLELSNNINLRNLNVSDNLLTALNISNSYNLKRFDASNNQITTLDFSSNSQLEQVFLFNSNLTSLNLRNGNNDNIEFLIAIQNDNLYCIEVDNPEEAPYPGWNVDSQVVFIEDCSLGVTEQSLQATIQLYPNPVKEVLQINAQNDIAIKSVQVYDILGKQLLQRNNTNQIDVSEFTSGLLFMKIETNQGVVVKKIIKE